MISTGKIARLDCSVLCNSKRQPQGRLAHFDLRHADGRQRHAEIRRQQSVAETDHGNIFRNPEALLNSVSTAPMATLSLWATTALKGAFSESACAIAWRPDSMSLSARKTRASV